MKTDNNGNGKIKQGLRDKLTAMNGKEMDAETVFIAAFKFIKKQGFKNLKNDFISNNINFQIHSINDIQWILTVPAIWDDIAKDKMLKWIEKAGLISPNIKDHCILKYEPDCASLSLQYEILNKLQLRHNNAGFKPNNIFDSKDNMEYLNGKKYILIDAGGGTVDIACHQFMNNYSVKELFYPTGGPWGDMYIDEAFLDILRELLGNDALNNIKQDDGNAYFDILHHFRDVKIAFKNQDNGRNVNIELSDDFMDAINKEIGIDNFENMVNSFEYKGNKNCFQFFDGYLSINCLIWNQYLFDPLINKVIQHIKDLLTKNIIKDCKYMYLVGGYSQTPYFQDKMIKTFGLNSKYNIDVIIPQRPILSVVDGAARMGLLINKNRVYIQSRILSKTYGYIVRHRLQDININEYSKEFINKNTSIDKNGCKWIKNCFQIIVRKGDCITHNQKYSQNVERWDKQNNKAKLKLYCSDMNNPKTIYDGYYLGKYIIIFNDNNNDTRITNEFTFNETINAVSYRDKYPQKIKKLSIKYQWT